MLSLHLSAAYIGLGGGVLCRATSGQRSLVSDVTFRPYCGGSLVAAFSSELLPDNNNTYKQVKQILVVVFASAGNDDDAMGWLPL